jgi:hypothetical protein
VPWPAHELERLVWEATDPVAEPWIPTPAEFQEVAKKVGAMTRLAQGPVLIG